MANNLKNMRCIYELLSFGLEYTEYSQLFCKSNYVYQVAKIYLITKKNDLALVHFNIRSLQKHIVKLNDYLARLNIKPEIIALTQTKLHKGKIHRNSDL